MAAPSRQPAAGLIGQLVANPESFELFQAIRLADDAMRRQAEAAGLPAAAELGTTAAAEGDRPTVEFRATPGLGFPAGPVTAATVASFESGAASRGQPPAAQLEVSCFGLFGPAGVLPQHYTALIIERFRRFRDRALRDFLDIFNQRAISLLYRAWAKYRLPVQQERTSLRGSVAEWDTAASGPRDAITAVVASLVGLGTRGLADRLAVPDATVHRYAGHFAAFPRTAESLRLLLADAFGMPVAVRQFVGRWLQLEPPDQTRLGSRRDPDGWNTVLGGGAIAGSRVWNVQSVVELQLGPLDLPRFRQLLPRTPGLAALADLARLYAGPSFEIRVRPTLAAAAVPRGQLGRHGPADDAQNPGSRLGWTTFLLSSKSVADRHDPVFVVGDDAGSSLSPR
jgi:type VI secretion system protein ImpH